MKKTFYITTPLYYVNAAPHIGHSYTQVAADAISRFIKQKGKAVYFMTGTDEHGQKVVQAAEKEKLSPKEFADKIVIRFQDVWKKLYINYDYFIRTTDKNHMKAVQYVLDKLYKKGDLYEGEYSGWYCTPCETFWTKLQIVNGLCPDCSRLVEEIKETNIFFKLLKYQDWLKKYIQAHPDFIKPKFREKEMLNYLEKPLADLCITRPKSRLQWGIEVPFSKEHVVYVWFDALLNYITGCGYPYDEKKFKETWPADIHLMAKDILRPHAIYWPIMLHALDIQPPKTVFAHGWWVLGGEKISKSKGKVVNPIELINKYGADAYRYFLLREIPFGLDGTYSEEGLIARINSDLANDLGNLLNRTLTMIEKYFSGEIPKPSSPNLQDNALKKSALELANKIDSAMENLDFSSYLGAVIAVVNSANKYIENTAPWTLWKEKKLNEIATMLYFLVEVLRIVAIAVCPVMPQAAANMWKQLGLTASLRGSPKGATKRPRALARGSAEPNRARPISQVKFGDIKKWGLIKPGTKINKGQPLFPRIAV